MSRFFSDNFASLTPYTPGEQPKERQYVKLNTNESPFPPAPGVAAAVAEQAGKLQLYSDPEVSSLRKKLAETYGVLLSGGSDFHGENATVSLGIGAGKLHVPDELYDKLAAKVQALS